MSRVSKIPANPTADILQGEMSATVFYFPESYIELLTLLRQRVLRGAAASYSPANIQIGISTNFNKLCGCVLQVDCQQL